MSASYAVKGCDSILTINLPGMGFPINFKCLRPKGHDGRHIARGNGFKSPDSMETEFEIKWSDTWGGD